MTAVWNEWLRDRVNRWLGRMASAIIHRGLPPEIVSALYGDRNGPLSPNARTWAQWLVRYSVDPGAADLLLRATPGHNGTPESEQWATTVLEAAVSRPMFEMLKGERSAAPAAELKGLAEWLVDHGFTFYENGVLKMPLPGPIDSEQFAANFFAGENIRIMSGSFISDDTRIEGNTYIGYGCYVTRATIGRYSSIANYVAVGPGEHDLHRIATSSAFYESPYETLTDRPCIIGPDVWIGASSVIRRGCELGMGSVVGANSFVNRNIEPFEIVGGSPARHLGFRFNEATRAAIADSQWWELPLNAARQKLASLGKDLTGMRL